MKIKFRIIGIWVFTILSVISSIALAETKLKLDNLFLVTQMSEDQSQITRPMFFYAIYENDKPLNFDDIFLRSSLSQLELRKVKVRFLSSSHTLNQLFFDGQNLILKAPNGIALEDSVRIASLKNFRPVLNFNIDGTKSDFYILDFSFDKKVYLDIETRQTSTEVLIDYSLNVKQLQDEILESQKIEKLRESLKQEQVTERPLVINPFQKKFPALEESINELLEAVKIVLTEEMGPSGISKRDKMIQSLKERLYQISLNVEPLYFKTFYDPNKKSSIILSDEERDLFNQESIYERTNSLFELFYSLVEKMDAAAQLKDYQKAKALAHEAIRVLSEVYLIAGKTKGSIGNKKTNSMLISFLTGVALVSTIGQFDTATATGVTAISLVLFYDFVHKMWTRDFKYKEAKFLWPYISYWENIKSSRRIRSSIVPAHFENNVPFSERFSDTPREWVQFTDSSNTISIPERIIRLIKSASGQNLSKILEASDCENLLTKE